MKKIKPHKIIIGVSVGTAFIFGGAALKLHLDNVSYENKKEAERIAFENRPILQEECVMNGYGQGNCSFTNTGKTAGALCGHILVDGPGTAMSGKFCSGQVQPQSTEKVEFMIPEVDELCDNGFEPWTEKCDFTFVPDDPSVKTGPTA